MSRKRMLTEAALIVGSILLAFAIDAGWDWRQERAEERELLAALHTEYTTNMERAGYVRDRYLEAWALLDRFFAMTPDEIRDMSRSARGDLVSAFCAPRSFDGVHGTTDLVIGSGKLELLRDPELRKALSTYRHVLQDSEEDHLILRENARAAWNREIELGGPWAVPGSEVGTEGDVIPMPPFVEASHPRLSQR